MNISSHHNNFALPKKQSKLSNLKSASKQANPQTIAPQDQTSFSGKLNPSSRKSTLAKLGRIGRKTLHITLLSLSLVNPILGNAALAATNPSQPKPQIEQVLPQNHEKTRQVDHSDTLQLSFHDIQATNPKDSLPPIDNLKQKDSEAKSLIQTVTQAAKSIGDSVQDLNTYEGELEGYKISGTFLKAKASPKLKDGKISIKTKTDLFETRATRSFKVGKDESWNLSHSVGGRIRHEQNFLQEADKGQTQIQIGTEVKAKKDLSQSKLSLTAGTGVSYEIQTETTRAHVYTKQKVESKKDLFSILHYGVGWEVEAKQEFRTNFNSQESVGKAEVGAFLNTDFDVKVFKKEVDIELKAGPEIKADTHGAVKVRPAFGIKIDL